MFSVRRCPVVSFLICRTGAALAVVGTLALAVDRAWASPPPNDSCASAMPIGTGTFTGDTTEAATDGDNPCGTNTGRDVWCSFAAPASGELTLDTCGSEFDTVLSVHAGCPGFSSNTIRCNDDNPFCGGSGLQSRIVMAVTGGQTYLIRIAGYRGAFGPYALNVDFTNTLGADNCASAQEVAPGFYFDTNVGATSDGGSNCGFQNGRDKWYRFTPPGAGTLFANTCGSSFDTVLSIHTGCPGTQFNDIACNDDTNDCGGSTRESSLAAHVLGGQTYLICVAGFNGFTGAYHLNLGFSPVAASESCSSASPISVGSYSGSTFGGVNEGLFPGCGESDQSPDVWYAFPVGAANGTLFADTCGSQFDTVLSLHDGCDASSPTFTLACDDDSCGRSSQVSALVSAFTTSFIRVSGFGGDAGGFALHVNFAPAVGADNCADATPITVGTVVGDTTGATSDGATTCRLNATQDVWFAYAAPSGGTIDINTCGSALDTVVSVHSACGADPANVLACDDDSPDFCPPNNLASHVTLGVGAGRTYLIRVAGYAGRVGPYVLHVSFQPSCPADFNQDGQVDPDDLSDYIACYFSAPPCPGADRNRDGGVDPDDLADFIALYFSGCA